MEQKRRTLSLLMVLALLLGLLPGFAAQSAQAADPALTFTATADKTSATGGDAVTVTVSVTNNTASAVTAAMAQARLSYETDVLASNGSGTILNPSVTRADGGEILNVQATGLTVGAGATVALASYQLTAANVDGSAEFRFTYQRAVDSGFQAIETAATGTTVTVHKTSAPPPTPTDDTPYILTMVPTTTTGSTRVVDIKLALADGADSSSQSVIAFGFKLEGYSNNLTLDALELSSGVTGGVKGGSAPTLTWTRLTNALTVSTTPITIATATFTVKSGASGTVDLSFADTAYVRKTAGVNSLGSKTGTRLTLGDTPIPPNPPTDTPYILTMVPTTTSGNTRVVDIRLALASGADSSYQSVIAFGFRLDGYSDKLTLSSLELSSDVPQGIPGGSDATKTWMRLTTPLTVSTTPITVATATFTVNSGASGTATLRFADTAYVRKTAGVNSLGSKSGTTFSFDPTPTTDTPYILTMVPTTTTGSTRVVDIKLALAGGADSSYRSVIGFGFKLEGYSNNLTLRSLTLSSDVTGGVKGGNAPTLTWTRLTNALTVSTSPITVATATFAVKSSASGTTTLSFADTAYVRKTAGVNSLGSKSGTTFSFGGTDGGGGSGGTGTTTSYTITLNQTTGGTIRASASSAAAGTVITITATPNRGYQLASVSVTGATASGTGNTRTFTMPARNVTVTPTFRQGTSQPGPGDDFSDAATTTVTTTGDNGSYTGEVTADDANTLVDETMSGKTPMIIITDTPEDATSVEIKLPTEVVKTLADANDEDLTIVSGIGSVTITGEGLDELAAKGGDVVVGLTRNGSDKVTVTITAGGSIVTDLKGGIIVYFPTLSSSDDGSLLKKSDSSSGTGANEDAIVYSAVRTDGSTAWLKGSMTVALRTEGRTFADVAGRWMEPNVKFATARAILQGGDDDLFAPDQAVTRAQVAQVLYNIEGKPSVQAEGAYADVEGFRWYASAAAWAKQAGIITGNPDGNFDANGNVSREAFAKILYTYAQYLGLDTPEDASALRGFVDQSDVGGWAEGMMGWAASAGIFQGSENIETGALELRPKADVTRAEMAKIMQSFVELVLGVE